MSLDPALVCALTRSVLPTGLGVAARDPTVMPDDVDKTEAAALAQAVDHRKCEFHAGRSAARAAMTSLSVAIQSVEMAADRSPVWPAGITGSISHSKTACVAAVGMSADWAGIGVDLEEATPLDPLSVAVVCTRAERVWLGLQPASERGLMAKLIFSAKEATYKAQYNVSGRLFGFEVLELEIDRSDNRFKAYFRCDQGPFAAGTVLHGSYAHAVGLLVTGVAIRHSDLQAPNS
ncbi:4'-phosphopantetheinyl transferase family protein [Sulfitobacter guttiformis]|uniref:Enterobactin synthase component D n=1 Tax=Sulfitobacter guttiformis TaxID=74349 RepID=A0A420DNW4_9RHOB|nr:4'-phosphopantetheinyl transferase superfamily protein [Sulfitobacter guttiformis]KIN73199.1 Phosphopantetheinyl transferase PptA [Sulfitobacter guttiformis KCTC 32187]RKE95877.1 4'-phosphopantetheinyl transferase EntD [Sulfitobacter guttiformis]